eukprot:1160721-Pelagomonas_calceolata.AAC.14
MKLHAHCSGSKCVASIALGMSQELHGRRGVDPQGWCALASGISIAPSMLCAAATNMHGPAPQTTRFWPQDVKKGTLRCRLMRLLPMAPTTS